jgi:hypothetical protein
MPEPPPRPARPAFADEARRPVRAERSDPLTGFAPEPMGGRPEPVPPVPPRMPRSEPMPRGEPMPRSEPMMPRPMRPAPVDAPKPPPLRAERSAAPPPPPPPAPPPMSSADQNLAEMAQRLEAALRRPPGEAPPVAPEPPVARMPPRNEPPVPPPAPAPAKSGFDNLEDEMASLLGRPKNPS